MSAIPLVAFPASGASASHAIDDGTCETRTEAGAETGMKTMKVRSEK
jgi:hypothetical protein